MRRNRQTREKLDPTRLCVMEEKENKRSGERLLCSWFEPKG